MLLRRLDILAKKQYYIKEEIPHILLKNSRINTFCRNPLRKSI